MTMMKGNIFIFSGPSGAGKSTVIKGLKKRITGLGYSISHTSRPPRHNETNGVDYHFVDEDTFRRMIDQGAFIEWANVYGNLYGTSIRSLENRTEKGMDVVLDIDHHGAKNIKGLFPESVLIYILPPSIEILEQRLRSRDTDDSDVIDGRIKEAVNNLKNCEWYDYLIINDNLEKAVSETKAVVLSSRCRRSRMYPFVKEMLEI
ncbi:MAG: guanylate kinase [Deltaproteobacteria bacterium]|nr:guanylate kinase [Deltaproteobacteria bacterium]